MMSDEFSTMLESLSKIEWYAITDPDNVSPPPTGFGYISIVLMDDDQAVDYPIKTLKETGALSVNLRRYDTQHSLDRFWRIRLKDVRFILLQSDGSPLPSPGVNLGDYIQVHVVYPTVFNNTNGAHEKFQFVAGGFSCNSDYITDRETGEPVFERSRNCKVDERFLDSNFEPSPDGVFSMNLTNIDRLDMEKVDKLRIEFSGSNVPFNKGTILTSL